MTEPATVERNYQIAAVDRALLLLEAVAERPNQGVTDLARTLGLTKTIVFRLLHTLEERGFVVRAGPQPVYSLGHRVGVLGERAGKQNTLIVAARPVMESLREETSENINLTVREGRKSLVLATLAGRHAIRIFAQAGRYGPLHAGGGSLLLLAWAPQEVRDRLLDDPLEAFTPATITDRPVLRTLLADIRAKGHNISLNDLDDGAFSIAAPIRNADGDVVAAISVAGAVARLDDDRRTLYLTLVLQAAAEISGKLGIGPAV